MAINIDTITAEFKKGDMTAFKYIYDNYCDQFYRIAISICGNAKDAEDIVQDSFIKIFKNIKSLRKLGKLENWMYKILTNTARASIKRFWRKVESIEYHSTQLTVEDGHDNMGRWEILIDKLQLIPIKSRNVFILHGIQKMPESDVAAILGISQGTVKSQYHKAKKRLRASLSETGAFHEKR